MSPLPAMWFNHREVRSGGVVDSGLLVCHASVTLPVTCGLGCSGDDRVSCATVERARPPGSGAAWIRNRLIRRWRRQKSTTSALEPLHAMATAVVSSATGACPRPGRSRCCRPAAPAEVQVRAVRVTGQAATDDLEPGRGRQPVQVALDGHPGMQHDAAEVDAGARRGGERAVDPDLLEPADLPERRVGGAEPAARVGRDRQAAEVGDGAVERRIVGPGHGRTAVRTAGGGDGGGRDVGR